MFVYLQIGTKLGKEDSRNFAQNKTLSNLRAIMQNY